MLEDIEECPFCGKKNAIFSYLHGQTVCQICGARGPKLTDKELTDGSADVISDAYWKNRPVEQRLKNGLQAIRKKWQEFDRGYSDYGQGMDDALAECEEIVEEAMRSVTGA